MKRYWNAIPWVRRLLDLCVRILDARRVSPARVVSRHICIYTKEHSRSDALLLDAGSHFRRDRTWSYIWGFTLKRNLSYATCAAKHSLLRAIWEITKEGTTSRSKWINNDILIYKINLFPPSIYRNDGIILLVGPTDAKCARSLITGRTFWQDTSKSAEGN